MEGRIIGYEYMDSTSVPVTIMLLHCCLPGIFRNESYLFFFFSDALIKTSGLPSSLETAVNDIRFLDQTSGPYTSS